MPEHKYPRFKTNSIPFKRTKVPVDYVTARSSTIFQHFYDVTNSSTEDTSTSSAEDLHKKLISKVNSHRKFFPFVSNEYSSSKHLVPIECLFATKRCDPNRRPATCARKHPLDTPYS